MDTERSAPDARFRPNIDQEIDQAWALHLAGASQREIATALKCAIGTANTRVKQAIERYDAKAALELDAVRIKAANNFDRWQSWIEGAWKMQDENGVRLATMALGGGLLKIERERARLLGTDAPRRLAVHMEEEDPGARPNMALLREFAEEIDKWERNKAAPPGDFEQEHDS